MKACWTACLLTHSRIAIGSTRSFAHIDRLDQPRGGGALDGDDG
jgi:hypothetical protein